MDAADAHASAGAHADASAGAGAGASAGADAHACAHAHADAHAGADAEDVLLDDLINAMKAQTMWRASFGAVQCIVTEFV